MKNVNIILICILVVLLPGCEKKAVVESIEVTNSVEITTEKVKETIEKVEETTNDLCEDLSELDLELQEIEAKATLLDKELNDATTQTDLNIKSYEIYTLWDDELNSLWKRIKELDNKESFDKLKEEEREWVKEKEAKIKKEGEPYEGGSIQPLIHNTTGADLTRDRCYYLADYLEKLLDK